MLKKTPSRSLQLQQLGVVMALIAVVAIWAAAPDVFSAMHQFVAGHADPSATMLLAFGPLVRSLQAKDAEEAKAMRALIDKAEAEDRDLTDEEQKAFAQHKANRESLKSRIARAQETELAEAGMAAGADRQAAATQLADHVVRGAPSSAVALPANAVLRVSENVDQDPGRGFRHVGDFCRSVFGAHMAQRSGGHFDQRLAPLMAQGFNAAAPSTFGNEATGVDGGFLVPPGFSQSIFTLSLEDQALLPMTDVMPVEGNGMSLPKDETTPWGSTGVRAYWQSEATAATATKPVFGRTDLRLKKLMALVPMSDELLADTTALNAYIPPNMARSIRWKTDEAVLFGTGAGTPWGCMNSAAAITVSKESGQATATLNATNLAKMIARLMPGSYSRAVWLINNDVLPALFTMTLGNYPIYLPAGAPVGGIQGSPYGSLLGRPIIVSQHAKSFSSLGDVMLVDLSYYQSITKAEGIAMATSMHLYFDADAVAFRATFRVDGQPKLASAVNPANGSNTLSPFVQLEAR